VSGKSSSTPLSRRREDEEEEDISNYNKVTSRSIDFGKSESGINELINQTALMSKKITKANDITFKGISPRPILQQFWIRHWQADYKQLSPLRPSSQCPRN
jgi:hypothetical protein